MSETLIVPETPSIENQSSALYTGEKEAENGVNLSLDILTDEDFAEDIGDRAAEAAGRAEFEYQQAVAASNDFASEHIDALHEAAIKEAAQRVADIYEQPAVTDT